MRSRAVLPPLFPPLFGERAERTWHQDQCVVFVKQRFWRNVGEKSYFKVLELKKKLEVYRMNIMQRCEVARATNFISEQIFRCILFPFHICLITFTSSFPHLDINICTFCSLNQEEKRILALGHCLEKQNCRNNNNDYFLFKVSTSHNWYWCLAGGSFCRWVILIG